ncbi:hypothetical protein QBC33DRAFT_462511, partial [Phialemonium atrogriseum]
ITKLLASPAITPPLPQDYIKRTAASIWKENLSKDEVTQVFEDIICLVFHHRLGSSRSSLFKAQMPSRGPGPRRERRAHGPRLLTGSCAYRMPRNWTGGLGRLNVDGSIDFKERRDMQITSLIAMSFDKHSASSYALSWAGMVVMWWLTTGDGSPK